MTETRLGAMSKLNFRSVSRVIEKKDSVQLWLFAVARIASSALDFAALAGIGLLATIFTAVTSPTASGSVEVPIVGEIAVSEATAVLIAMGTLLAFGFKSLFTVLINLRTALLLAKIEGDLTEKLTKEFFRPASRMAASMRSNVSAYQTDVMVSTGAISAFLNARLQAISESIFIVSMLSVFAAVNLIATVFTIIYVLIVIGVLNLLISKRLKRNSAKVASGSQKALEVSRDLFGVRREAIAFGRVDYFISRVVEGKRESSNASAINSTINLLPRYVVETALIAGIFLFVGSVVLFSDLQSQAVTIGVFLAGGLRLVTSILPLQSAYIAMVSSGETAKRAFANLVEILASPADTTVPKKQDLDLNKAFLEFQGVTFSYSGAEITAIEDVSFTAKKGEKTAIVGPSGAGKSTIFELATGFVRPAHGFVQVYGQDPTSLVRSRPGILGVVPQRPHLISGTLAQNVSLDFEEAPEESRVRDCLEKAQLSHILAWDAAGLNMEISSDSGRLSGGEIQRLGIARALYRNPDFIFLDEATSALDAKTEDEVTQAIDALSESLGVILIAHRLSTVMNADKIIYLDKGKVVTQGTFAELKKQVPDFAKAVQLMDLGE
jgi:ABC-type multidrug transport system fused ATPase/permease subunit